MHQSRRLECMPFTLAPHLVACYAAQLCVDDRQQPVQRILPAILRLSQQRGNVFSGIRQRVAPSEAPVSQAFDYDRFLPLFPASLRLDVGETLCQRRKDY